MSGNSDDTSGQGMIVNPKPKADNQDWDGDDADRADRLRFEEEPAMIREQSEARAAARALAESKLAEKKLAENKPAENEAAEPAKNAK